MSSPESSLPLLYCALDTPNPDHAAALTAAMARAGCGIKVGMELFYAVGPERIREMCALYPDLSLFLDLKFHDIPNTVAAAVRSVTPLEADYINVHATGGLSMMRAAKESALESADEIGVAAPKVLGVTILTSLEDGDLAEVGLKGPAHDRVLALATLAKEAGLDGIVCSAHEIEAVRTALGDDFILMVPGIRPASYEAGGDDQRRVMTPHDAVSLGASHLVIGRPIRMAENPQRAASKILEGLV